MGKPYYDFSINSLSSDTYGPYDARYFKVHVIRSGRLTFREIQSESQIVFQVSTSGPISLPERTVAADTFTLDVSTTAGLDVAALWTKNLRADIYTGKVSLTFPEVLPLVAYPDEPLFQINLHNYGQLSIRFAKGQKVCICEHGSTKLDCRVERVSSVAGGYPYLYVDGGAFSRLQLTY